MPAGTAPNVNTWDITPQPRRPGIADVNSATLENDGENPPDPSRMPTAELLNTIAKLVVALGAVVPNAVISVSVAASIVGFQSPKSGVSASDFFVTHNGAGDVTIVWNAGFFPAPQVDATATINDAILATHTYSISATNITNGVRVRCQQDGIRTDMAFTVVVR